MSKASGGLFFGNEECFCGGCTGCIITTVTLIRPIWDTTGTVKRCAYGFLKYEKLCDHPDEKRCKKAKKWRIINLPTCQVITSGDIDASGTLVGLKDKACYPVPYAAGACADRPNGGRGPFTFESILWPLILIFGYNIFLQNLIDTKLLIYLLANIGIIGLHCDGDLTCRYILQLQTAVECNGKIKWPNDPCVPRAGIHDGVWIIDPINDLPNPKVP
jgi:hypothetical protein